MSLRETYGIPHPSLHSLTAFNTSNAIAKNGRIFRYVIGHDTSPTELDLNQVNDFFAKKILSNSSSLPLTGQALLESFAPFNPQKKIFHIAEDGQFPMSDKVRNLIRTFRLAIYLQIERNLVFISTSKAVKSETTFLQLMAWDEKAKGFNFYLRKGRDWFYSGNSQDALEANTRGRGPFSGHINGNPVMKELKQPWSHWHSSDSRIEDNVFEQDDPFLTTDFFKTRANADEFEPIVRSGIHKWNKARISKLSEDLKAKKPIAPLHFMRQILDNPTINLASTTQVSQTVQNDTIFVLPTSFFINEEAFQNAGISWKDIPIKLEGAIYLQSLQHFDFQLHSGEFVEKADTHFAFLVPVPAAEDSDLLNKLLKANIFNQHLCLSLLMVDFPNAIYSLKRKQLLKYIPDSITSADELKNAFLTAVQHSGKTQVKGTAEYEFWQNWEAIRSDDWLASFQNRIQNYLENIQKVVNTQSGYNSIVMLAEYRKFLFKQQPIFEFDLTLASTNIEKPSPLAFTEEAQVIPTGMFELEIQNQNSSMEFIR